MHAWADRATVDFGCPDACEERAVELRIPLEPCTVTLLAIENLVRLPMVTHFGPLIASPVDQSVQSRRRGPILANASRTTMASGEVLVIRQKVNPQETCP
jgi:hypothetical protein